MTLVQLCFLSNRNEIPQKKKKLKISTFLLIIKISVIVVFIDVQLVYITSKNCKKC